MLEQNKQMAAKYNILQWHEKSYTGKGIRIAVFDDGAYLRKAVQPYGEFPFGMDLEASHGTNVAHAIHEFLPNATLVMVDVYNSSAAEKVEHTRWIADPANKIDLISCSCILGNEAGAEYWKILERSNIPMCCAAGNANKEHKDNDAYVPASFTWTYCMSALSEVLDRKCSYGNWGQFLECVLFDEPYVQNDDGTIHPTAPGTSFCQPVGAALIGAVIQANKEIGIKNTRDNLYNFISKNCKDYGEVGRDDLYGYGLLILPDVDEYLKQGGDNMRIILTVGSKTAIVDGKPVSMPAALTNINGNILAPVRFIGEQAGFKVTCDNNTKVATLEK